MTLPVSELTMIVRAAPSAATFDVRDQHGQLVMEAARHECELLIEMGHVVGVANKKGVLRYVRLQTHPRVAMKQLRRKLYRTGRTIAEDCQTVKRDEGMRGALSYSHFRNYSYAPAHREQFLKEISGHA